MEKKVTLLALIVAILMLTTSCQQKAMDSTSSVDTTVIGDYQQFDYRQLKEAAEIIAKVEVVDDLTEENSQIGYDEYDTKNQTIIEFYSMRKVKIIDTYYGKDLIQGDTLEIIEPTAVVDNQYLHTEGYEAMKKGGVYIVFIGNDTASGNYSIISANNGLVDLIGTQDTTYFEIKAKAITEFQSDLPKATKDKILNSKVIKSTNDQKKLLNGKQKISVKDKNGKLVKSYDLLYGYDQSANVTYIKFAD